MTLYDQLENLKNITYLNDQGIDYLPWFSDNDEAIGFLILKGKFKEVFFYFFTEDLIKSKDNLKFFVLKNPYNLKQEEFHSIEFKTLINFYINDVLLKINEFEHGISV